MNNQQKRILRRRSPPRIFTIEGGRGIANPQSVKTSVNISDKVLPKDALKPIIPNLLNISSTGTASNKIMPSVKLTSVKKQPNQENFPRVNVGLKAAEGLQWKELDTPSNEKIDTKRRPKKPALGAGYSNKSIRVKRSNQILEKGTIIEAGTRQVWRLSESYNPKKFDSAPKLIINGTQAVRITFNRGAGSIIQDIEIPPTDENCEIEIPTETSMFTIEGLGGEDLVNSNSEIGSGSITTNYPNGPLSAIGFQRLSKIQQIGYFRYLSRGAYLQANESASSRVMDSVSVFSAGEVLSKIDNLRFYCTAKISTFVLIVKTLPEKAPQVKIGIEGITTNAEPKVIKRSDAVAYLWSVKPVPDIEGPAIIDIITDETTDINSAIAYQESDVVISELLQSSSWTKLVDEGPISNYGASNIIWHHEVDETIDEIQVVPNDWTLTSGASKLKQMKVQPKPKPKNKPMIQDAGLPQIEAPMAHATTEYQFDITVFAGDDDQDDVMSFELISGPHWLKMTESGVLAGTPTNDDAGVNHCKVRVSDKAGLSSDAIINIEVKAKVLNRAPYWKPNIVKKNDERDLKINRAESLRQTDIGDMKTNPVESLRKNGVIDSKKNNLKTDRKSRRRRR